MKQILTIWFVMFGLIAYSQTTYKIKGKVTDQKKEPLFGAALVIHELKKGTATDSDGFFEIDNVPVGEYHLHISFLGYKCVHYNLIKVSNSDVYREFSMQPDNVSLTEIVIEGNSIKKQKQQKTTSIEIIDNQYIEQNLNANIIKSIENLPGISSMDVGQGFSKPVIRGLGFNRVAVAENGVKQEGQQWGADHGLEIDQFGVENIEIIKGPSSLTFGSDAIAGVIQILPNELVEKNTLQSNIQTVYKSVNNYWGSSIMSKYRKNDWYFYFRYTHVEFGDYKVPADSFFYNRYRFPIFNNVLKNTAGKEQDFYFTVGIIKNQYKTSLSVSNVLSKVGFFPGSHGIPSVEKLFDDNNSRNLDLPFQKVNHFKIISNTKFLFPKGAIDLNFGYQNNFRQEWSLFHTHYQNQTPPVQNPDLELQFKLNTISSTIKYKRISEKNIFETGISVQHQINETAGYMFLLPQYFRTSLGVFAYNKYIWSEKLIFDGGVRFDYGNINLSEFYSIYAQRYKSHQFSAHFQDFTWALGLSYLINKNLNFKTNVGKSFRMPNASELSANGIHHGSFRYEVGDSSIRSEYSYQFDAGIYFSNKHFTAEISTFVNYFPNFIFLSPTGSYLHPEGYEIFEADAGQVYQYVQSKAFRTGGELLISYKPTENLTFSASAEFVFATDFTYPIPFTPPLNIHSYISYHLPKTFLLFSNTQFLINNNSTYAQNRIARNELKTDSYNIFNFIFSSDVVFSKININFALQIQNIFDTKYFNHLSFYRLIELPEAGRNIQILIKIPLEKNFEK